MIILTDVSLVTSFTAFNL